jgi:hypothetical protein
MPDVRRAGVLLVSVNSDERVGYDAKFCRRCDIWLEGACGDRGCEFCARRPERPSLVPYRDL